MDKGNVPPESGGCWYCHCSDGFLAMSWEFDTLVHIPCIVEQVKSHPDDLEARIFAEEFDIKEVAHD